MDTRNKSSLFRSEDNLNQQFNNAIVYNGVLINQGRNQFSKYTYIQS